MVITRLYPAGGTISERHRYNSDSSNNYAFRRSINGATDTTSVGDTGIVTQSASLASDMTTQYIITNIANRQKILTGTAINSDTAGAGNAPNKVELVGKWNNTTSQINSILSNNAGTGDYDTGSEIIVFGKN